MDFWKLSPYVRRVRPTRSEGLTPAYVDPDHVFTYIQEGEAAFLIEDVRHEVKKGDMILMPPYARHIINTGGRGFVDQCVIHFDLFHGAGRAGPVAKQEGMTFRGFMAAKDNPETLFSDLPYVLSPGPAERKLVEEACLEMKDELDRGEPFHELALKARILDILKVYLRAGLGQRGRGTRVSPKVWRNLEKAISHIHAHHARPLPLKEISRAAGLSLNYFCQLFKDYAGISAHRYLNAVRVDEAKKLLREGKLNITQVAERTGFSTIHHFSRVFSETAGVPPSKYQQG